MIWREVANPAKRKLQTVQNSTQIVLKQYLDNTQLEQYQIVINLKK